MPLLTLDENQETSWRPAVALAGLLVLLACATTPLPPTQALQAAEMAIATAEQARVADFAAPELGEARAKLAAARIAVRDERMGLALHLAEQSRADAELASAKAYAARAIAVNSELQKTTDALEQEMQRNSGDRR